MTKFTYLRAFAGMAATLFAFAATPQTAQAQGQSGTLLSYDNLSFFEEGLAQDVGGATLRFRFLLDQAYIDNPPKLANRWKTTLQFSTALETELSNGWQVGVAYTGIFDTDDDGNDDHLYALFVNAPWGTLSAGRVTGLLENTVARKNRVGNATLTAGRGLGGLEREGIHYFQSINAYQVHFALDENADAQAALFFEAPIGVGAHTFGVRGGTGTLEARTPRLGTGDIEELAGFYGYTLGSLSVGFEYGVQDVSIDGTIGSSVQRYASVGANYKVGRTSYSVETGRSDFLGTASTSAGLGLRYDIARGFSANLGVNYSNSGILDTWRIPVSIRYEF